MFDLDILRTNHKSRFTKVIAGFDAYQRQIEMDRQDIILFSSGMRTAIENLGDKFILL